MSWSAAQYTRFEAERTRPVRDLVAALPAVAAAQVVDIGCGPGNSTAVLSARYPDASVLAFDRSPDMCAAARTRLTGIRVECCTLEDWLGDAGERGPWDVILSNAVLQWVPDHATLLPRLMARLAAGGALAFQVPDNLDDPSHVAMEIVAREPAFAPRLAHAAAARTTIASPEWYHAILRPLCAQVEIWRTTYFHELRDGVDGIVEWMKGTGLRPYLDPLPVDAQLAFVDGYRAHLSRHYRVQANGSLLLPFPRLFVYDGHDGHDGVTRRYSSPVTPGTLGGGVWST